MNINIEGQSYIMTTDRVPQIKGLQLMAIAHKGKNLIRCELVVEDGEYLEYTNDPTMTPEKLAEKKIREVLDTDASRVDANEINALRDESADIRAALDILLGGEQA